MGKHVQTSHGVPMPCDHAWVRLLKRSLEHFNGLGRDPGESTTKNISKGNHALWQWATSAWGILLPRHVR